jgi:predicted nucleic acid-binding protein
MKIIVSDAGPILSLTAIGKMELLSQRYPEYFIPEIVFHEISAHISKFTEKAAETIAMLSPRVVQVQDLHAADLLSVKLDAGEGQCIQLVKELDADFFLVEDAAAKSIAVKMRALCFFIIASLKVHEYKGIIAKLHDSFSLLLKCGRVPSACFITTLFYLQVKRVYSNFQ